LVVKNEKYYFKYITNKWEYKMKKLFSLAVTVFLVLTFMSSNSYAQNNSDAGQMLKLKIKTFLNYAYDFSDEIVSGTKDRLRLKDGSGENCNFVDEDGDGLCDLCGFIDADGDGECDKCGGDGQLDRDRLSDGKGSKYRNGN
jgi:hypothetical protein